MHVTACTYVSQLSRLASSKLPARLYRTLALPSVSTLLHMRACAHTHARTHSWTMPRCGTYVRMRNQINLMTFPRAMAKSSCLLGLWLDLAVRDCKAFVM